MAAFDRDYIVRTSVHFLVTKKIGKILYKKPNSGKEWIEHRALYEQAFAYAGRNYLPTPTTTAFNKWMKYLVTDCGLLCEEQERDEEVPCNAPVIKYRAPFDRTADQQLLLDFSKLRPFPTDEPPAEPACVRCLRPLTEYSTWTCNACNNWLQANHAEKEDRNTWRTAPDFFIPVGTSSTDVLPY